MKKSIINKTLLGIVLFVILWQVLSLLIGSSSFIFPGPIETVKETLRMLSSSYVYECIGLTIGRMVLGFIIALALAFIFGVIAGNFEDVELLLRPTMTVLKSLPTASIVYLFLVIAGAKLTPLYIVVLIAFPILYESVTSGIKNTPHSVIQAGKVDGSSFFDMNLRIRIPLAMPYILVGVASTFALSLKIEIMAEVITGYTRLGLGSAILAAQRSDPTNMVPIFAYSLIAIVLMLIVDTITAYIQKHINKGNIRHNH